INEDPYGKGWIVRIKPTDLERDLKELVTGEEAIRLQKEYIDREDVNCGEELAQISKKFYT
ncbi:MAG TPA: glycine cleavage system protein H, partial [Aquifex aeolicus]|nr:glycine cleavage system protein H [Aquifex aeolicus]